MGKYTGKNRSGEMFQLHYNIKNKLRREKQRKNYKAIM